MKASISLISGFLNLNIQFFIEHYFVFGTMGITLKKILNGLIFQMFILLTRGI
jgi:hypothetical protein